MWEQSPKIGGMAHKLVKPLAPNLVADIPQVEAAVHFIEVQKIFGTTDNLMEATALQTNSTLFDVLDFGVISGDPHRILSSEGKAAGEIMISERLAKKMFGDEDPLGKKLGLDVVAGVFETPRVNQSIGDFDILEHLPYDEDNEIWTGQDSYTTFIKLCEGADIAEVEAAMPEFIRKHGIEEHCKEWQITYCFVPLTSTIYVESDVMQMQMIYSAIALVALIVACLNYVLLTISSLAERSRTIATMKCNGASRETVFSMLLAETFLILLVSVAVAVILIIIKGIYLCLNLILRRKRKPAQPNIRSLRVQDNRPLCTGAYMDTSCRVSVGFCGSRYCAGCDILGCEHKLCFPPRRGQQGVVEKVTALPASDNGCGCGDIPLGEQQAGVLHHEFRLRLQVRQAHGA